MVRSPSNTRTCSIKKSSAQACEALRDAMRKQVAEEYLADPTLSLGEVAFLLGFSEPGAFHRAFKRWYKITPQSFRKQQSNSLHADSA